jgi:hypothetical protein
MALAGAAVTGVGLRDFKEALPDCLIWLIGPPLTDSTVVARQPHGPIK